MSDFEREPLGPKIEATAGAIGMLGGSAVAFTGVVIEAVRSSQIWSAVEVMQTHNRTGKELVVTGAITVFAGMCSWFRGIRNWR